APAHVRDVVRAHRPTPPYHTDRATYDRPQAARPGISVDVRGLPGSCEFRLVRSLLGRNPVDQRAHLPPLRLAAGEPPEPRLWALPRSTPSVFQASGDRRRNVRRAFALRAGRRVEGFRILLVDDVSTSTATVDECASLLAREGAASVDVLVVARALLH